MQTFARCLALAVALTLAGAVAASAVELQWWSHWAIEDNKKIVLFEVKKRFEAKNPGNTVTITFYEKKNMFPALRAAFTAGSGFPDVFYYDMDVPEFMATGWLADLSSSVRWDQIEPYGKAFWTRPGPGGKTGTWAIPVEAASDELYYNRKIFKELGITVPPGYAFTQEQFKDIVAKCAKAGYAAFATGAADRDWAAHYIPNALLTDKLGADEFIRLLRGELSWKDPRVVEVFHYYKELIDLGAYAKTLSSMVDAVESWTLARARRTGRVLQDAGIAWLEDPVHHSEVAGLAELRRRLEVPIAAGEHLYHLDAFRTLLEARAVDIVILDLARIGGVTPWRKIAALAQAHRVPVCGHVVPEIQVHLLSAVANGHMVEYVPRSAGILRAMPRIERGDLVAPTGPGLGLELDEAAVRRHRIA